MARKKRYFAQIKSSDPKLHRAKYFDFFDDAKEWLEQNGGGTVKKRNAGVVHSSGMGLGRVVFDPPLRVWKEIYDSDRS